jgi:hypothetical protein
MVASTPPGPSGAPSGPEPAHPGDRRPWLIGLAGIITLLSLLGPLASSGIWDPPELEVADLSRRIAHTLMGDASLALAGANNEVPTQGDLGKGQLPFTLVALGFRAFGLYEWAGRLPLALFGLIGVAGVYVLVARLADRAAAAFTALCLATMPLFYLHARTMLGDIVTMAALGVAMSGLALAVFDRPRGEGVRRHRVWRGASFAVALLALAAGLGARGVLIGVAVPSLAVGVAWLIARPRGQRADRLGDAFGAVSLLLGISGAVLGLLVVTRALEHPNELRILVGSALAKPKQVPTFDAIVHQLGHALVPWAAVIPFAMGRMLAPPVSESDDAVRRQTALRVTLILFVVLAFGAYSLLAPHVGVLPFGGVVALAAMVGLALRDFEQGAHGSRALAMGVLAFAILLATDYATFPVKGLSAFGVEDATFPESFKGTATRIVRFGTVAFGALFFVAFMERHADRSQCFRREEYLAWPRFLSSAYGGSLRFGLLATEVALVVLAGLLLVDAHIGRIAFLGGLSTNARLVGTYGSLALPVLVALPVLALFARDLSRAFFSPGMGLPVFARAVPRLSSRITALLERLPRVARFEPSRGVVAVLAVTAFAAVMSLGYYPALAAQISPREVFESYRRMARSSEPLGLLGRGWGGAASYYAGQEVPMFSTPADAYQWLVEGSERRWLVVRSRDLAELNSLYRRKAKPPKNLPVLDARSSEILLVASDQRAGEKSANPFDQWLLASEPRPTRPLAANLGGQLAVLGWDVRTPGGPVVDAVEPGRPYEFVIYYRVDATISGKWETFVHIDGFQKRFNADHATLQGKYPLHLWRVGDYIADVHRFTLEPNFSAGAYKVYFGLFVGSRRLEVKRGEHSDNRLQAGTLHVR